MLEVITTVAVAAVAGGAALNNRIHNRINNVHDRISMLDRRIDEFELSVAQDYVAKVDLEKMIDRMEDHMIRIEDKLDRIAHRNTNVE